ncbi:MAG TPA: response regulator transcription factor [Clostridia bacterium]|jgi:DNA-binding response OmpR family regulator|nr:response regulator transcription factor [Clostridiaceae bacterium]HOF26528.1 response regulator transcription factor [Clostridia bacterium]HOM34488.1 response regulator transcription factor [Clostridia bacterium]HOR90078.1 response regulator transcription factor [Clostridia bacterium]HOT70305.1 response regulator transcription factor [Clostridia bacterium]
MYNILICDDDYDIVSALKIYLSGDNYNIFTAYNGKKAIEIIKEHKIHLVLLDIMMPEVDGITAMVEIRKISNVPIILLTAKSEDNDKILGLNLGADDYITKPFNPVEVLARVKSQLRRYMHLGSQTKSQAVIRIGDIELDDDAKTVTVSGEEVSLTPIEFDILRLLMKNPGKVYSTKHIYSEVWDDEPYGAENTVAVHVRHIREKIEINPAEPRYFKVVWGQGYKMERQNQQ